LGLYSHSQHSIGTGRMTNTAASAAARSTKTNYSAEGTTTTTTPENIIVPSTRCIYTTCELSNSGDGGLQKEYFGSFQVEHKAESYRWKVHIGDIVAVATEGKGCCLTPKELVEWQPKHLKQASPHWKVGLVLALVQVKDPGKVGNVSHECHVEWLEKALDTPPDCVEKLARSYRTWSKQNEKTSRLPHVLLRSFRYQCVSPTNLLPVQIKMLSAEDFKKKDFVIWDPNDRFSFFMHCPKIISYNERNGSATYQPDPAMDSWPELNHLSFAEKTGCNAFPPKPLEQAWSMWEAVKDDGDLLQALVQGYRDCFHSKHQEYVAFKNRHDREGRKIGEDEQERLRILQEERHRKLESKTKGKRRMQSTLAAEHVLDPSSKRTRLQDPGETPKTSTTLKQGLSKTSDTPDINGAVEKIAKSGTPAGMTRFHQSHTRTTHKSKSSLSTITHVGTAASTKSSSIARYALDQLRNLRLSQRQQGTFISAPVETLIDCGEYSAQACDVLEGVNLSTDIESLEKNRAPWVTNPLPRNDLHRMVTLVGGCNFKCSRYIPHGESGRKDGISFWDPSEVFQYMSRQGAGNYYVNPECNDVELKTYHRLVAYAFVPGRDHEHCQLRPLTLPEIEACLEVLYQFSRSATGWVPPAFLIGKGPGMLKPSYGSLGDLLRVLRGVEHLEGKRNGRTRKRIDNKDAAVKREQLNMAFRLSIAEDEIVSRHETYIKKGLKSRAKTRPRTKRRKAIEEFYPAYSKQSRPALAATVKSGTNVQLSSSNIPSNQPANPKKPKIVSSSRASEFSSVTERSQDRDSSAADRTDKSVFERVHRHPQMAMVGMASDLASGSNTLPGRQVPKRFAFPRTSSTITGSVGRLDRKRPATPTQRPKQSKGARVEAKSYHYWTLNDWIAHDFRIP